MRPLVLALCLTACASGPSRTAANDASPDAAVADSAPPPPDATPDAPELEASVDAPQPIDDAPAAPDVVTGADAAPDASPPGRDAAPDVAPDADPLAEHVSAELVTVRGGGLVWSTPRTQMCTVTGGVVSVGADYDAPERSAFVGMGPLTGPVIVGTAFASDVRGTIQRGREYFTNGAAVRRLNVILRGEPRAGFSIEITALGCVIR